MKKLFYTTLILSLSFGMGYRGIEKRDTSHALMVDKNPKKMGRMTFSCKNTRNPYTSIQDALNNAKDGDIIEICPGTYVEDNLEILKSNLTIESTTNNKEDVNITNKNKNDKGNIFKIPDYIHDFLLKGVSLYQTSSTHSGVYSNHYINNIAFNNLYINSKGRGIYENNSIANVIIDDVDIISYKESVYLKNIDKDINFTDINFTSTNSNYSTLKTTNWGNININVNNKDKNYITSAKYGIDIDSGELNISDSFIDATQKGIYLRNNFADVNISNNIILSDDRGVYSPNEISGVLYLQDNNITINGDSFEAVDFYKLSGSTSYIMDNNISGGNYGIVIKDASNAGEIKNNIIKNASVKGLYLLSSEKWRGFKVTNNCFEKNNAQNVESKDKNGYFDSNYYYDWNGIGSYKIPIIPKYDEHPLSTCPLDNTSNSTPVDNTEFDAWNDDSSHSIKDRNITTKIVNSSFNIIFSALDKPFTGTVCAEVIDKNGNSLTDWQKITFNNQTQESSSFKVGEANKDAKIKITWVMLDTNANCPLSGNYKETNATDDFAIRPKNFDITSYPSTMYAGEDFNITFKALDENGNETKEYNETKGSTFNIAYIDIKNGCKTGILDTNVDFKNGINTTIANYDEVGDINLTIKDTNFANVDNDDTPINEREITPKSVVLHIKPYKIELNTTFSDNNITYMDKNLYTNYAKVVTNIKALNKQGKILDNFNGSCYAKDINISYITSQNKVPQEFKAMYVDMNDSNFNSWDNNWSIDADKFNNGEVNATIIFNIYKEYAKPISVKELNFTKVSLETPNIAKIENNETLNKDFLFYYARINANDMYLTNVKNTFENLNILVYDTNHNHFINQTLINWYLNTKYNLDDVKILGTQRGYVYNSEQNVSNFNVNLEKTGYDYNLSVTNNGANNNFVVIHFKTPYYLWYSKYKDYNDSNNSNCTTHYCVEYHYNIIINNPNASVGSGKFTGSSVDLKHNIKKTRQGIKIYR